MKLEHPAGPATAPALRQRGFTLIELMVSMVIGLFIALALVTLLINVNRNNSELSKTNRLIENGRFAAQMLQADISHAGYWGGHLPRFDDLTNAGIPSDVPTALPDPCVDWTTLAASSPTYKVNLIGIPVQSYEIPAVVPSPTVSVCGTRVVSPQPSTDVLFVRHLDTCSAGVDTGCAYKPNDYYFQVERCGTTVPTTPYFFEKYVDAGTVDTTFTGHKRAVTVAGVTPACTAVAFEDKRRFVSNMYYVRNYAVTAGDGIPTLMRSTFTEGEHPAADALIEGIEGFSVEFGLDNKSDTGANVNFAAAVSWANANLLTSPTNRGDGIADGAYVRCTTASPCTAAQLMNAVVARVYVLVRSEAKSVGYTDSKVYCLGSSCPAATSTTCPVGTANTAPLQGPFCDGYKRHVFTQTIRLTNVSGRRETP